MSIDRDRSRETPPSVRFLGCRVYVAAIVVLVTILAAGATDAQIERLAAVVYVDRRTIERWRRWWRTTSAQTLFWRIARARFMPPIIANALPGTLLDRFAGDEGGRLLALLRFVAPITGPSMTS